MSSGVFNRPFFHFRNAEGTATTTRGAISVPLQSSPAVVASSEVSIETTAACVVSAVPVMTG